jgi:2,3-dihydro-2,3-dihydroxybenzoate dehydrogenase
MIARGSVIVTGAAGGIGRAVAARLADQGVAVGLLDRDGAGLARVTAEIGLAGGKAAHVAVDVADRAAVEEAVADLSGEIGPLGGLVCAAGVLVPGGLAEVTAESWERHLAVNATGTLHCLQAAHDRLVDGGAVVVVSSNAARVPRTGMLAYAASKAAASALARCAGLELAARGIRCNVVEPGSTDTAMQRALWPDAGAGAERAIFGDPASYRLGIPLGRIAEPEDVAAVVCFLLSEESRHVTLQQVYVDGGASL